MSLILFLVLSVKDGFMALPKEIQDLINFIEEQEPYEANNPNLSPHIMVETAEKWLTLALERGEQNPRLLNFPEETAKKLLNLARQFAWLKQETPKK